MSDPLSVAAGIAGLVSLGLQLAQGLHTLADGIGSAGIQVRRLALEVGTFSKLFGEVRQALLEDGAEHAQTDVVRDVLDICELLLEPLQKMQERLIVLFIRFRDSPSKIRNFGLRVQWMFSMKNKMLWLRGVLDVQHRVLNTILELIILQTTKDRSQENITHLSVVLNLSVRDIHGMLQDDRHATEQSGLLMLPYTEAGATSGAMASEYSQDDSFDYPEPTQSALMIRPRQDSEVDQLAGEVQETFDETLQQIGGAIWDDTRALSRKVVRRAKAAMVGSEGPDGQSSRAGAVVAADDASASLLRAPDSTSKSGVDDSSNTTRSTGDTTLTTTGRSTRGADRRVFRDADGQKYMLPNEDIKTYEDMKNFLLTLYIGPVVWDAHYEREVRDDLINSNALMWQRHDAIKKGEYHLLTQDEVVLLPEFWSSLISRDFSIQLRFHKDSINEQLPSSSHRKQAGVESAPNTINQFRNTIRRMFRSRSRR